VWFGVVYNHVSLDAQSICENIYTTAVKRKYMREDVYILRPDLILGMLGVDVEYRGHMPADYVCKSGEFEILKYHHRANNWDHFVAGNGNGIVTYDPWGAVEPYDHSITVSEGVLESKRIFKR
jgi:hypothetical protein